MIESGFSRDPRRWYHHCNAPRQGFVVLRVHVSPGIFTVSSFKFVWLRQQINFNSLYAHDSRENCLRIPPLGDRSDPNLNITMSLTTGTPGRIIDLQSASAFSGRLSWIGSAGSVVSSDVAKRLPHIKYTHDLSLLHPVCIFHCTV